MLNLAIMKNPANYAIVVIAVILGMFLVDAVANVSAAYNVSNS